MIIIGYSGHAYVIIDALISQGINVESYCDNIKNIKNPYCLNFLESENSDMAKEHFEINNYVIGIGDNQIRETVQKKLINNLNKNPINAIHFKSIIASKVELGVGVQIAANAIINPLSEIGNGTIINTGAIIEHECKIGDFSHICPGAVLAGNVTIGNNTFIGANSVIKQGVQIGKNVLVGAGSVVIRDIPDNAKVVGNIMRYL